MAGIDELANACGGPIHPILVNLDLFGDANFHNIAPLAGRGGLALGYVTLELEIAKPLRDYEINGRI